VKASDWIIANGGQWPTGEKTVARRTREPSRRELPEVPTECAACDEYLPDAAKCREVKKVNNCGCVMTWKANGHRCPIGKW
jgi:hypothetical protein